MNKSKINIFIELEKKTTSSKDSRFNKFKKALYLIKMMKLNLEKIY